MTVDLRIVGVFVIGGMPPPEESNNHQDGDDSDHNEPLARLLRRPVFRRVDAIFLCWFRYLLGHVSLPSHITLVVLLSDPQRARQRKLRDVVLIEAAHILIVCLSNGL